MSEEEISNIIELKSQLYKIKKNTDNMINSYHKFMSLLNNKFLVNNKPIFNSGFNDCLTKIENTQSNLNSIISILNNKI